MAERICTCTLHQPIPTGGFLDTPCKKVATHRLKNEDGTAFLCGQHARAVRDMYEPGQLRKMRVLPHKGDARRSDNEGKGT